MAIGTERKCCVHVRLFPNWSVAPALILCTKTAFLQLMCLIIVCSIGSHVGHVYLFWHSWLPASPPTTAATPTFWFENYIIRLINECGLYSTIRDGCNMLAAERNASNYAPTRGLVPSLPPLSVIKSTSFLTRQQWNESRRVNATIIPPRKTTPRGAHTRPAPAFA